MKSKPKVQNPTPYATGAEAFARLLQVMDELRENCPWDQKQTLESVRHLSIEEVYELSEAIQGGNVADIEQEIGDLLLHVVFYCRIGREEHLFDIETVINRLCEKLIRRHPHVYGNVEVSGSEQVIQNWEAIKQQENGHNKAPKRVLSGVPDAMPALLKAYRMQEKAAAVGFDWPNVDGALQKLIEEAQELQQAVKNDSAEAIQDEFGDLLFSFVNLARKMGVNPDDALSKTNFKFRQRFNYLEDKVIAQGKSLNRVDLETLDQFWNEAKAKGL